MRIGAFFLAGDNNRITINFEIGNGFFQRVFVSHENIMLYHKRVVKPFL